MTSRILVVDDDTALAEMIGIVLRTEGFDTVFCADGAKAVDVWRSERPDLILLDLMLPGMDGIEICTRVRGRVRRADHHADRAHRHRGRRQGPRGRRRRLHRQALQPEGARRPHPHPAASRPGQPANDVLRIGDLTVDVAAHEVRRADELDRAHAARVRAAGGARRRSRSRCSRARCCSSRCGATTTRPTRDW